MTHPAQIDKRTKKVLLVLFSLFSIVLVFFGFLYYAIAKFMKKEASKTDEYMSDLIKNRIVTSPKTFKKALFYQEKRVFYNKTKWAFRILFFITIISFAIVFIFFDSDYLSFFTKAFELLPIIKWPSIKETNEALSQIDGAILLKGPDWMIASIIPTLIFKNPNFSDPMLYISVLYYICAIMCIFSLTKSILAHIARINEGKKMAFNMFEKKSEEFNISSFSQAINSPIPNQEKYLIKDTEMGELL